LLKVLNLKNWVQNKTQS